MENNFYRKLLTPEFSNLSLQESPRPYRAVSERHAQILWFEQKHFRGLTTDDGAAIEVISPGLWNSGAGPDFKKAHLKIGEQEVRGDVEVHLTDAGWKSHGHHRDDLYKNVVLHLSFWKTPSHEILRTAENTTIRQCYLEPFLELTVEKLITLIDIEVYPYEELVKKGTCADQLFSKLSSHQVSDFFESAAEWRLREKARRLYEVSSNANEAFLYGISQALGYKNNARAFSQLYSILKNERHLEEDLLLARALNLCGFFREPYLSRWKNDPYYLLLYSLDETEENYPQICLNLHQIRPLNHPIRRIAYLIKVLLDPDSPSLFERLALDETRIWNRFLPDYDSSYWNTHYVFGSKTGKSRLSLIGEQLEKNILINSFIPLLYERYANRREKENLHSLWVFYQHLLSNDSGKKEYLKRRFFESSPQQKTLKKAIDEQGALQLHADFCSQFETSCIGCPLISRYEILKAETASAFLKKEE